MSKNATSHDYARCLQQFAEFLLSRNAFGLPWMTAETYHSVTFHSVEDKEKFLAAVKALGAGEKRFTDNCVEFIVKAPGTVQLTIRAPRNLVCRLVTPVKYECDPFLSPDEEQELGGAA